MKFPSDTASALEWAIFYVVNGFSPIVIHGIVNGACTCGRIDCRPGKHPVSKGWATHRLKDEAAVRAAFSAAPLGANVGLIMGQQLGDDDPYLVAFDEDGERGRERFGALEAKLGPFPPTLTSRTGRADGGSHRIVMLGAGQDAKRVGNRAQHGLDVRAKGGQIVVAPSLHFSGGRYTWSVRRPIAELPDAWFEAIASPEGGKGGAPRGPGGGGGAPSGGGAVYAFGDRYLDAMLENMCGEIASMREGGRNQRLFAGTCTALEYANGHRVPFGDALERLAEAGRACGLPAAEVDETIAKARKHVESSGATRHAPAADKAKAAKRHAERRERESKLSGSSGSTGSLPDGSDASSTGSTGSTGADEPDAWRSKLVRRGDGGLDKTIANVDAVLRHHPALVGRLRFDALAEHVTITGAPWGRGGAAGEVPRRWSDVDDTACQVWLRNVVGLNAVHGDVARVAELVARDHAFDPIVDRLRGLPPWDGIPRAATWLVDVMGAEPSDYVHAVGRRWLVSAVARAMKPGCQVDTMLILEGGQGRGKSSALRALALDDAWFLESPIDLRSPDAPKLFRGRWIVEFPELASLKGSDIERIKAVITTRVDSYRRAYARHEIDVPRRCVLVGSTNDDVYLRDPTGARRFQPVRIGNVSRDAMVERIVAAREQLWAEALAAYDAGDRWWLDEDRLVAAAEVEQEARFVADPWEPLVASYLAHPTRVHVGVTTAEVLGGPLGIEPAKRSRVDELRVAAVLRHLGCERKRRRNGEGRPEWRFVLEGGSARGDRDRRLGSGSAPVLDDPLDPIYLETTTEGPRDRDAHGAASGVRAARATEVLVGGGIRGSRDQDARHAANLGLFDGSRDGGDPEGGGQ